jgi:Uncharacterized conserved protein (DUF2203)
MKRREKRELEPQNQVIRVWTRAQAEKALPLIASIVSSVREERLNAQAHHLRATRLAERPGRPDRQAIIEHEEAVRDVREANERFEAGLRELLELNVYCLDPARGLALIPFAYADRLAWFVFDLFEKETLRTWRYHEDPLTTRRPVDELTDRPATDSLVA